MAHKREMQLLFSAILLLFYISHGNAQNVTCSQGFELNVGGDGCDDIDECADSALNNCQFTCHNTPGGFLCSCPIGCNLDSNSGNCIDIDECTLETDDCTQSCTNLPCAYGRRGYSCSCDSGYMLGSDNHTCIDINECADSALNNCQFTCDNTLGSFLCSCPIGCNLESNLETCSDIDECTQGLDDCTQSCTNLPCAYGRRGYSCSCGSGYMLGSDNHTCIDINECEQGIDNCEQICQNNVSSYNCFCELGCTLNSDGFTCTDINECDQHIAICSQVCTNQACTDGRFKCSCFSGYSLADDGYSCDDVDECMLDTDGCEEFCINNNGSYTCDCQDGCQLDSNGRTCSDVDECTAGTHECRQICINRNCENGQYECRCNSGYTLSNDSRNCDDVDECRVNNGNCEHNCVNTMGTYHCTCRDGYALDIDQRSCDAQTCAVILTAPENGMMSCPGGQLTDRTCYFSCDPGYILEGSLSRTCQEGSSWNGTDAICSKLQCTPLVPTSSYFIVRPCSNELDSTCRIACPDGYSLSSGNTTYEQSCVPGNNAADWTATQTCNAISTCNPDPCQNNGFCLTNSNGQLSCFCPAHLTGTFCEIRQLTTPSLPQLSINQQSNSLFIQTAQSTNQVDITIVVDPSITVWPENTLTIAPNQQSVEFRLTGSRAGVYRVKYYVYSSDRYATTDDGFLFVYQSDLTSAYFETNNLRPGIVKPGCCMANLTRAFCPVSGRSVSVSSSCSLQSSNDWVRSQGITFLHSGGLNLPVSLLGIEANFNPESLTASPNPDPSSSNCTSSCSNQSSSDCVNWQVSTTDAQLMAQHHSLLRTFLDSVNSLIPSQISIQQTADSRAVSYSPNRFMSSIIKRRDARSIDGCHDLFSDSDSTSYVITSNANLVVTVNGTVLTYNVSDVVCYILELCSAPQSTLYISLPEAAAQLVKTLPTIASYLTRGWHIDIYSSRLSSYGLGDNRDLWFWNGNERMLITLLPHVVGLNLESGHSASNGYLGVSSNFQGNVDMSIEPEIPARFSGEIDLQISTIAEFVQVLLQLSSSNAKGFLINNDTDRFMRGYSIDIEYSPSSNDFFGNILSTVDNEPCPVSAFVRYDQAFMPQWVSLYSTCVGIRIFGMPAFGLTSKVFFPSSSSHWPSSPNTTVRVSGYNYGSQNVQLGRFIAIPNSNTNGSYIEVNINVNGTITGAIYKALINIYGTYMEADIMISTSSVTFTAVTRLYNAYNVRVTGNILPSDAWDNAQIEIDVEFLDGASFQSYAYLLFNSLNTLTDARLDASSANLNSSITAATALQTSVNTLQAAYDNNVMEYEKAKTIYDSLVAMKQQKDDSLTTTVLIFAAPVTVNSINAQCQDSCSQECPFPYDQTICIQQVNLPIDVARQDTTTATETVRYDSVKAVQQCSYSSQCESIIGVKWIPRDLYRTSVLTPLTYDGISCQSACVSNEVNRSVYMDFSRSANRTQTYSFTQSQFTGWRSHACSQSNDCQSQFGSQPCLAINDECDASRRVQLIAAAAAGGAPQSTIDMLTNLNAECNDIAANISLTQAQLKLGALRLELSEQQLNLTKEAYANIQPVLGVAQITSNSVPGVLGDQAQFRDWVQGHVNVLQIVSLNFSTELAQTNSDTIQLSIYYTIPYLGSTTHLIVREVDLSMSVELITDYLTNQIINDALRIAFSGQKRSLSKREVVSLDSLSTLQRNCVVLKQILNYLTHVNVILSSALNETNQVIANITWLRTNLETRFNSTISSASSVLTQSANLNLLRDRESAYLTEGQAMLTQLSDIVRNTSMIDWLKPMEEYHNATRIIGGTTCFSLIDCLEVVSESLFIDLLNIPMSTVLRLRLSSVLDGIRSMAETRHMSLNEVQSNIWNIYDIVVTVDQLNYWCASVPAVTPSASEVPVASGADITLQCPANSSLTLSYRWSKDNFTIAGATTNSLTLTNFERSSAGSYRCIARGGIQSTSSLASRVLYYQSAQLTAMTNNTGTYLGNDEGISIWCSASAVPFSPNWSWQFRRLSTDDWSLITGENSSVLYIDKPQQSHEGWYRCQARTEYDSLVSEPIRLTLFPPSVAVNRYQFQLAVTSSSSVGSASQINSSLASHLQSLNLQSTVENVAVWPVENNAGQYEASFYIRSSDISSSYRQDQPIDALTSEYSSQRWQLDQSKWTVMQYFTGLTSLNDIYSVVNGSFTAGDREYICPTGSELHSNYILCVPCLAGQYVSGSNTVYRLVQSGLYVSESVPRCQQCPYGSFQTATGADSCSYCQDLYSTETTGSSSVDDCIALCQPHSYSSTGLSPCQSCPSGYYQPQYGAHKCLDCRLVYADIEQCNDDTPTTSTDTPTSNSASIGIIIGSTVVPIIGVLILCVVIAMAVILIKRSQRKRRAQKKAQKTKVLKLVPRGLKGKRRGSTSSTEAFVPKDKKEKKKYTSNPIYMSEMQTIASTSEYSFMKTEATAVSNVDDLSELEKAVDLDDANDETPLLLAAEDDKIDRDESGKGVTFAETAEVLGEPAEGSQPQEAVQEDEQEPTIAQEQAEGETQEPAEETQEPIEGETQEPTGETQELTEGETQEPTGETQEPTEGETQEPTGETQEPTEGETEEPTGETQEPTEGETQELTEGETQEPTEGETQEPTGETQELTEGETQEPTGETQELTEGETQELTEGETQEPTGETQEPTEGETQEPTEGETQEPTGETQEPTEGETEEPTEGETEEPTGETQEPTEGETQEPTEGETQEPTGETQEVTEAQQEVAEEQQEVTEEQQKVTEEQQEVTEEQQEVTEKQQEVTEGEVKVQVVTKEEPPAEGDETSVPKVVAVSQPLNEEEHKENEEDDQTVTLIDDEEEAQSPEDMPTTSDKDHIVPSPPPPPADEHLKVTVEDRETIIDESLPKNEIPPLEEARPVLVEPSKGELTTVIDEPEDLPSSYSYSIVDRKGLEIRRESSPLTSVNADEMVKLKAASSLPKLDVEDDKEDDSPSSNVSTPPTEKKE